MNIKKQGKDNTHNNCIKICNHQVNKKKSKKLNNVRISSWQKNYKKFVKENDFNKAFLS